MPVKFSIDSLLNSYFERTPRSRAIFARAEALFPNGVTHVGRFLEPYPVYVERAEASRKWDVDGNEYVDFFGGHGALLLGHCHPEVTAAVQSQATRGAHFGASHELEVEWGALIQQMVPSAERLRFTISGTEATHLAIRLARAFTGRRKLVRFAGHFHGWHDHVAFPAGGAAGILPGIVEDTIVLPPNDEAALGEISPQAKEIAAVILEPTGATFGQVPTPPSFLHTLREWTAQHGVILIFDEVISGFRCAPGGAQQYYGVLPDLTTLAKIVAGGYPGAAVAGRKQILEVLDYRRVGDRIHSPLVMHQGTHNAGPISAAAGLATLRIIRDTDAVPRANRTASAIRDGMNAAIRKHGLPWRVYGQFSDFHLYLGEDAVSLEDLYAGRVSPGKLKGSAPLELIHQIRMGMLALGVDFINWPGGLVSAVHNSQDIDRTVTAFETLLQHLAPAPVTEGGAFAVSR
ncbi:MAG: aspartate aminotransferase family protein [Bryobacteraceae bacterium]|nr:aspartate aminotransferase family protein [Bryobacteraceae bacterium]MDW8378312.1 aspartate aminotransferase family protein [Bryobacterales bacterium]